MEKLNSNPIYEDVSSQKPSNEVLLRALEPSDLGFLYELENNPSNWAVSNTRIPFSKHTLKLYLNQVKDIYSDKQLRLIVLLDGEECGLIDLFDFDAYHQRAGVGILLHQKFRNRGIAKAALEILKTFAAQHLGLKQLFCNILSSNLPSIKTFQQVGFECSGTKTKWHRNEQGDWEDELFFQCFIAAN